MSDRRLGFVSSASFHEFPPPPGTSLPLRNALLMLEKAAPNAEPEVPNSASGRESLEKPSLIRLPR